MFKWNCMSKTGDLYETVDDVAPEFRNLIRPHMFPPEESVARELNLDRCIRILPHHQNTGGFFIAVIRKKASASAQATNAEGENAAATDADATTENQTLPEQMNKMRVMKAPPAKRVTQTFDENPFSFMNETNQLIKDWPKIK